MLYDRHVMQNSSDTIARPSRNLVVERGPSRLGFKLRGVEGMRARSRPQQRNGMAMSRKTPAVAFAAVLAATALSAKAQDGDFTAEHAFTREACKPCHIVEPERAVAESDRRRTGVSRHCEHFGDDGNGDPGLSHEFTPQDAEPDSHAAGDRGCDCIYSESARSSLKTNA